VHFSLPLPPFLAFRPRDVLWPRRFSDSVTQISDLYTILFSLSLSGEVWVVGGGKGWVGINGAADERSVAHARRHFYRPTLQHRHGLPLPALPGPG